MKTKKTIVALCIGLFLAGLLSSCAIDRKCPAYSQATVSAPGLPA